MLASAWTKPLSLPSLVETINVSNPYSKLNESRRLSWARLDNQESDDWQSSLVLVEEHSSTLSELMFVKSHRLPIKLLQSIEHKINRGIGLYQKLRTRQFEL